MVNGFNPPSPPKADRKTRMFALQTQFNTSYPCVEAVYYYKV